MALRIRDLVLVLNLPFYLTISACSHSSVVVPKDTESWAIAIGPKDIDALMANGEVIIISTRILKGIWPTRQECETVASTYTRENPFADHMEVKCISPHPNPKSGWAFTVNPINVGTTNKDGEIIIWHGRKGTEVYRTEDACQKAGIEVVEYLGNSWNYKINCYWTKTPPLETPIAISTIDEILENNYE